jgi:hypothetical protein
LFENQHKDDHDRIVTRRQSTGRQPSGAHARSM